MVKNNVLTPVLAGVLGVSLVGSGVGFYMMNKNAKDGGADSTSSNKTSPRLAVMAENIDNTIDKAEMAAKGELDYANNAVVKVSFGSGMQEMAGETFKDIEMDINAKQKGGNQEVNAQLKYDNKTVASLNEVLQRKDDNDVIYVQIPELSDAYISIDQKSIDELMEESSGMTLDTLGKTTDDIDFDADAFQASLDGYEKAIKDNFPAVKEEGKLDGDISGVSYSYTSKTYNITEADAKKVALACLETAKTDSFVKSYYDSTMEAQAESMKQWDPDYQVPTYESEIDDMIKELQDDTSTGDDSVTLVTYEDSKGEFTGFEIRPNDEEGVIKFVTVSSDEAEGIDMLIDIDGDKMSCYGALKLEGDVLNGGYDFSYSESGSEVGKASFKVSDVKTVGDAFAGTIRFDVSADGESAWWEIASNSTEDNIDVKMSVGYNGKDMVTTTITSNKTEASDVKIPDGKIYNYSDQAQLDEYLNGCDVEGFKANAKSVLGDELFNDMFGSSTLSPDWDQSVDVDDFDWSEYDVEDVKPA